MSIVGEFEFSFIMFHLGEDYEVLNEWMLMMFQSFLQWKNILFLATGAYTLLTSKNDISICSFYKAFMKVLYLQLSEIENDFFTLTEGNEVKPHPKSEIKPNKKNFVIKCLEVSSELSFE